MSVTKSFQMIDNYIYLYHVDTFIVIPSFPDKISDSLNVTFNSSTPLSRSAPIYSYAGSGPRSLQINLHLHRDMMTQINYGVSNARIPIGDDYVDTLIRYIQAIALPAYGTSDKMVNPPLIAVRFGNDIFIKGVVRGGVTVTYETPILVGEKYAQVDIAFNVEEVDPFDAQGVMNSGSFRGIDTTLERNFWKS